ncbi:MAG TPA: ATPase [Clostridia bacterium]|jgi:predicted Fe-Mo cluster-binding NifX family protein|nr:ATPase [Clostridia bacterium]
MKIALPLTGEQLSLHFGHCTTFAFFTINPQTKEIIKQETLTPPPHEPGVFPIWLKEQAVDLIIAGGLGQRAQGLFAEQGIQVIYGVPTATPETIVNNFLKGNLKPGKNICDH